MATVESIYQRRRDRKAKEREQRIEKTYQEHPALEELNRKINICQVQILKARLSKSQEEERYKLDLYGLQEERAAYMRDYQVDPGYMDLDYDCPICKDWGFTLIDGRHENCSCMLKVQESLRRGQAHLSKRIEKENFENFDLNIFDQEKKYDLEGGLGQISERENIIEIREEAYQFIRNFRQQAGKSMLFYGPVGLGKSYMCYSIAKELIDQGYKVLYMTMNELMDMMQLYNFDRSLFVERYSLEDYYAVENSDLLILDDLGTEITNNFVKTVLFNIINSRMINNKKMLISTNLSPDELMARYDERISSRLIEYVEFYKFFGENKRWDQ